MASPVNLNVAVIGAPGVGKSSFLNSIGPPSTAKTRIFETGAGSDPVTREPQLSGPFAPFGKQDTRFLLTLVDLPGIGGVDIIQPNETWTQYLSTTPIDVAFVVVRLGGARESIADYISRSFVANAMSNITSSQVFVLVDGCKSLRNGDDDEAAEIMKALEAYKSSPESGVLRMFQSIDSKITVVPDKQVIPYCSKRGLGALFQKDIYTVLDNIALKKMSETQPSARTKQVKVDASAENMKKVFSDEHVFAALDQANPEFKKKLEETENAYAAFRMDMQAKLESSLKEAEQRRCQDAEKLQQEMQARLARARQESEQAQRESAQRLEEVRREAAQRLEEMQKKSEEQQRKSEQQVEELQQRFEEFEAEEEKWSGSATELTKQSNGKWYEHTSEGASFGFTEVFPCCR
jgi:GTPase SAR1 family protein